jgi:hypothetical protein
VLLIKQAALKQTTDIEKRRTKARRRQIAPTVRNLRSAEGHDEEFPLKSLAMARTDDSFGEAMH